MRWGPGPVFLYECLANSRRWQTYAIRSVGVLVMLAAIATIAASREAIQSPHAWRDYAALGQSYFYAIIGVLMTLVMLAAPAATAGAICVDRARGTLTHMLATDLSDPEIVLGKLAARLLPILGLVACTWPVLAVCSLLGGIDPTALTFAFAIILAVALLGCTMAMALSVWASKPHEVVLVVYTVWMLAMLFWPLWMALAHAGAVAAPAAWSLVANPYYLAFAPYSAPGRVGLWEYFGFFAAVLGASVALAILAIRRMRPVARRGIDHRRRGTRLGLIGRMTRRLPGPSIDGNPVLWREWHRGRPSRWMVILIVALGGATSIACAFGAVMTWRSGLDTIGAGTMQGVAIFGLLLQLMFGLLMVSAVAPMSMSEERQRGSLDLLAATVLSTRTIVLGKWLGTFRLVPPLAIGPGLVAFAFATASKAPAAVTPGMSPRYFEPMARGELLVGAGLMVATILVHGALIASVGLALAVWIARQSRAVALSAGFAVIVGAGWPMLVGVSRVGPPGQGMMCLSPVVAAVGLIDALTLRARHWRDVLWWITFWDVECLAMAMGLLWLTVRTFDGRFGRMPERPGRTPMLSDVVVVLAGLIGVGGLFGVIASWGKAPWPFQSRADGGIVASVLLIAVGFVLVSALASGSMSWRASTPVMAPEPAAAIADRRAFAIRWWAAFRLVLLLAVGPALIGLGLATATIPIRVVDKSTPAAGGGWDRIFTDDSGITYVQTTSGNASTIREATEAELAAAEKVPRDLDRAGSLILAAVAAGTVVAHGAAFVGLGAALGIWIRRRGWAIAASVGAVVFVTVVWPILYLIVLRGPDYPLGLALASVIPAYCGLLFRINHSMAIEDMTWWAIYWDVILIVVSVIVSGLAIRILDRRSRGSSSAEAEAEDRRLQPAIGEPGSASIWG
jgi:ABC-type transport system involved in multi-copper enzyme maturation permease subunit